jgi:hypothetical protein
MTTIAFNATCTMYTRLNINKQPTNAWNSNLNEESLGSTQLTVPTQPSISGKKQQNIAF